MAIRILLEDTSLDFALTIHASGSYSPDVLDDLSARAVVLYREALGLKVSIGQAATDNDDEGDD